MIEVLETWDLNSKRFLHQRRGPISDSRAFERGEDEGPDTVTGLEKDLSHDFNVIVAVFMVADKADKVWKIDGESAPEHPSAAGVPETRDFKTG
jgi:hypothetical protein